MQVKLLAEGTERTYALIFDHTDDPLEGLRRFADAERISAARLSGVGGFAGCTLGFYDPASKEYERIHVGRQTEVLSFDGDIALKDGAPEPHVHVVLGERDGSASGGHLMEASVHPTLEVLLVEAPAHLRRVVDEASGLPLISVAD